MASCVIPDFSAGAATKYQSKSCAKFPRGEIMATLPFGKYTVETSNEDKVFFPGEGITKGDLIEYYREIAEMMLPFMKDRLVVMHRFPDGINEDGFYHKDTPDFFPEWIRTKTVSKEDGGRVKHVICDNAATLVYLANQGCITPHTWLSRADKLHHPDQMIFDLDPSSDNFAPVRSAAKLLRKLFDELELVSFVKTTGSRGLHVLVPLDRSAKFDTVRAFARDVAKLLAHRHPRDLTTEARKNKRRGRLYLDTARNSYAQTAAPPYAVRPKPTAPVATPLDWDELNDSKLGPQTYHIGNIFKRLARKENPWRDLKRHTTSLDRARNRLNEMLEEQD
jgi:bifunctional non-homologous end joining protein LigD